MITIRHHFPEGSEQGKSEWDAVVRSNLGGCFGLCQRERPPTSMGFPGWGVTWLISWYEQMVLSPCWCNAHIALGRKIIQPNNECGRLGPSWTVASMSVASWFRLFFSFFCWLFFFERFCSDSHHGHVFAKTLTAIATNYQTDGLLCRFA